LTQSSLVEKLLVVYLDCVDPKDEECHLSAEVASRALEIMGQKLATEIPNFDGSWLPTTSLCDRVVRRVKIDTLDAESA
jgi:hypothetical protein